MKIDCNPTQPNKLVSALICTIFAQDAKIGYIRQSQASLLLPSFALSLHSNFQKGLPHDSESENLYATRRNGYRKFGGIFTPRPYSPMGYTSGPYPYFCYAVGYLL